MNAEHCFMFKVLFVFLLCLKDGFVKSEADEKLVYNGGQRHKRQVTVYEIEVLMVADYSVYSFWRDRAPGATPAQKDANAKRNLKQYYVNLLHAADLRYSSVSGRGYEMRLLYAGLYIADTAARAPWIENIKNDSVTPTSVDVVDAIVSFNTWRVNGSIDTLPEHDHAIAFTTYPLTSTMQGYRGKSLIGIAATGGLCSQNKDSLAKDSFDANTATQVAKYIAFNLKAGKDGIGNKCSRNQGYVMEAVSSVTSNATKNQMLWIFSNCTQDYFDSFIRELNCNNMNCMTSRSSTFNGSALDMYAGDLLGQTYTPDEQCGISDGQGSYMARQHLDIDYTSICSKMACTFGSTQRSSRDRIPWEGTSCGNGKICIKGFCTVHESAPSGLSETCLFGDQPGLLPTEQQTCYDLVIKDAQHHQCYQYEKQCCQSCGVVAALHGNLRDCKYGDKGSNCDASQCKLYIERYKNDTRANPCCLTCAQNTTLATVVSTTPYSSSQGTTPLIRKEALNTVSHRSTERETTTSRSLINTTTFSIPKIHECPWTHSSVVTTQKGSTSAFMTNAAAESRGVTFSDTLVSQTNTNRIITRSKDVIAYTDTSQVTDTSQRTKIGTTAEARRSTSEAWTISQPTDTSLRTNTASTFVTQTMPGRANTRHQTFDENTETHRIVDTSLRTKVAITKKVETGASEERTRGPAIIGNTKTHLMTDSSRYTHIISTFETQMTSKNSYALLNSTFGTTSKYSDSSQIMNVTRYSKTLKTTTPMVTLSYTPLTAEQHSKFLYQNRNTKQTSVVYSFNKAATRIRHKLKCSVASVCSCAAVVWLIALLTILFQLHTN